ncbi:Protein IWS1-like protein [Morus notabilis]|uniref:Protein IWS1-like protein n=1 Tax=Morus notabilis TaxID=981085 RepID=W9QGV0_9ROSA|nr:Protein IWS1-like protein [Morus notabilis]
MLARNLFSGKHFDTRLRQLSDNSLPRNCRLSPLQLAAMSSRYVPYRDKGKEPLMDRDYKQSDHKQSSNPQEHLVDLEHDLEDRCAQGRPQTPAHHNDPLPEKLKPLKKRAIKENDAADKEYFPAETPDSARRLDDEGGTGQRKNGGVEGSGPSGKKQSIHTEVRKYGSSSKTGSARKLRKERDGDVKETWQALAGDDREVDHVMDGLSIAAKEDAKLNREGKPAICIVDELHYLADALSKKRLQQALLDRGILNLLRTWLQDKSLLNTATRQAILKLLINFPIDLQQDERRDHMKNSGLQEVVEFLFGFDDETIANRILATHLVKKWGPDIVFLLAQNRQLFKSMNIEGRKSILPERVPLRSPSVKMPPAKSAEVKDCDLDKSSRKNAMRHKSSQSSSPKSAIRPEPIHTDYIVQSPSQINLNEVTAHNKPTGPTRRQRCRDKGKEPLRDHDYRHSHNKQSMIPRQHLVGVDHNLEDWHAQGRPQTLFHHNDPLREKFKPFKKRSIKENDDADKEYFSVETADSVRTSGVEGRTTKREIHGVEGSGPSGKKQSSDKEERKYGSGSKKGSLGRLRKKRDGDVEEMSEAVAAGDAEAKEGEEDNEVEELFRSGKKKKKVERVPSEIAFRLENAMAKLELAAEEDAELNREGEPAIYKLKSLPLLTEALSKKRLQQKFLDHGILNLLRTWLEPLPDGSLLNRAIREAILKILIDFPIDLRQEERREQMKKSGLGKAIEFLSKCDEETTSNKKLAKELVDIWSRQLFNKRMDIVGRRRGLPERILLQSSSVKMPPSKSAVVKSRNYNRDSDKSSRTGDTILFNLRLDMAIAIQTTPQGKMPWNFLTTLSVFLGLSIAALRHNSGQSSSRHGDRDSDDFPRRHKSGQSSSRHSDLDLDDFLRGHKSSQSSSRHDRHDSGDLSRVHKPSQSSSPKRAVRPQPTDPDYIVIPPPRINVNKVRTHNKATAPTRRERLDKKLERMKKQKKKQLQATKTYPQSNFEDFDSVRQSDGERRKRKRETGGEEGSGPSGKKQSKHKEERKYGSGLRTCSSGSLQNKRDGHVKETREAVAGGVAEAKEGEEDEEIKTVMAKLEFAAKNDAELNREGKPAIHKLETLPLLKDSLSEKHLQQKFLDHGILSLLRTWLEDGSKQQCGEGMVFAILFTDSVCVYNNYKADSKETSMFPIDLQQEERREQMKKSGLKNFPIDLQQEERREQMKKSGLKNVRFISEANDCILLKEDLFSLTTVDTIQVNLRLDMLIEIQTTSQGDTIQANLGLHMAIAIQMACHRKM